MESELPLRDIHLPEPVGWWPLAPGWWILIIGLPLLVLMIYGLWRFWKRQTPRKLALRELQNIELGEDSGLEKIRLLGALLRRTAMTVYPREQVAGLVGEAWLAFLDQPLKQGGFLEGPGRLLVEAAYRPESTVDLQPLLKLCREWIKALPKNSRRAIPLSKRRGAA